MAIYTFGIIQVFWSFTGIKAAKTRYQAYYSPLIKHTDLLDLNFLIGYAGESLGKPNKLVELFAVKIISIIKINNDRDLIFDMNNY